MRRHLRQRPAGGLADRLAEMLRMATPTRRAAAPAHSRATPPTRGRRWLSRGDTRERRLPPWSATRPAAYASRARMRHSVDFTGVYYRPDRLPFRRWRQLPPPAGRRAAGPAAAGRPRRWCDDGVGPAAGSPIAGWAIARAMRCTTVRRAGSPPHQGRAGFSTASRNPAGAAWPRHGGWAWSAWSNRRCRPRPCRWSPLNIAGSASPGPARRGRRRSCSPSFRPATMSWRSRASLSSRWSTTAWHRGASS